LPASAARIVTWVTVAGVGAVADAAWVGVWGRVWAMAGCPITNAMIATLALMPILPVPIQSDDRRLLDAHSVAIALAMVPPPEITRVSGARVACDGAHDGIAASLGHPRVWLQIDEHGYVDCGYCDRRFVLIGGPADGAEQATLPDIASGASV